MPESNGCQERIEDCFFGPLPNLKAAAHVSSQLHTYIHTYILGCRVTIKTNVDDFCPGAQQTRVRFPPGANSTIVSYNASAGEIYNANSSLARFENKNISVYIEETL
jgi:hypothetical protein